MTLKEMMDALSAGENVKCDEGIPERLANIGVNTAIGFLKHHEKYEIYVNPKWYERKPFVKTLCKNMHGHLVFIIMYKHDTLVADDGAMYDKSLTPLTHDEILDLAGNAPDE